MHSFILVRHGHVIAEGWWDPYRPGLKHTLYSVSKSFTSTAIGLAVAEGRLTVDDQVIGFFPGALPAEVSGHLAALRVRDLLSMTAGQDPDPTWPVSENHEDWVKGFLETPIEHEPGSRFLYNSLATYMLSAIVTKVTGETACAYLTPRLFEPLGITDFDWETCPRGINSGGWGLRLRTEALAKFGQLLLQNGIWNGKQILPEAWVKEATTLKIMQEPERTEEQRANDDWLQGYCYQIWRCRNNAFRADGAFGQYILAMPDQDAVIAITSETSSMQGILDVVWRHLLPAMKDSPLPEDPATSAALKETLSRLKIPVPEKGVDSPRQATVSGASYTLEPNDAGLRKASFDFQEDACTVSMHHADASLSIPLGAGRWILSETRRHGPNLLARAQHNLEGLPPFKIAAAYTWQDKDTLVLTLRYIESPHTETITCTFEGDGITLVRKTSIAAAEAPITGVRDRD